MHIGVLAAVRAKLACHADFVSIQTIIRLPEALFQQLIRLVQRRVSIDQFGFVSRCIGQQYKSITISLLRHIQRLMVV